MAGLSRRDAVKAVVAGVVGARWTTARAWAVDRAWTTPVMPFRIAEGLYYVGSQELAAYLVATPAGNVLINSNLESSPPLIRRAVEQLGFRWRDSRVLLISHAHRDHAAGSARIVRETGATYMVMDGDVTTVESGGAKDFAFGHGTRYPAVKVDRVLRDGDEVRLGGVVLHARKTAGHTRGCTTWTLQVTEGRPSGRSAGGGKGSTLTQNLGSSAARRALHAVIVGSWNVLSEYRLVERPGKPASYPGIAADFEHTFAVMHGLPCDVFLAAHGSMFDMPLKLKRSRTMGEAVWVDPEGYRRELAAAEQRFRSALDRQRAG